MAATATITISGTVKGQPGGGKTIAPPAIVLAAAATGQTSKVLTSGDNAIAVPAGSTVCVVTPPADNTVALATGTAGADPKAPDLPFLQTFPAGATSFIIHAAADMSSAVEFDFA